MRAIAACLLLGVLTGSMTVAPSPVSPAAGSAARIVVVAYRAPVAGTITVRRGFSPPATRYGPGHLGVDLAVPPGAAVLAAGPGTVRFAGQVAGRGVVVVLHPDGISTEYEPIAVAVRTGQVVRAGTELGRVRGEHAGCEPGRCLHWGARRATSYLDPFSLLHPLGVVRLLPWGWTAGSALP